MADAIERERGIIVVLAVPKRRKIVRNFFFPKSIEYLDKKNKNITVSRKNINCLIIAVSRLAGPNYTSIECVIKIAGINFAHCCLQMRNKMEKVFLK